MSELRADVIRIQRGVEVRLMTLPAVGVFDRVVPTDMTGLTGLRGMRAFEGERCACMIEIRGFPAVHVMATLTIPVEAARLVIRIFCISIVSLMAGEALDRSARKDQTRMTVFTQDGPMLPHERTTRFIVIDRGRHALKGLPCLGIVTVRTLPSKADEHMIRL
jgi:hypothetical protein